MHKTEICKIDACHIDELVDINHNSFEHPWSRESFLSEVTNKFAHYIGIKIDDKLAGYIGIWFIMDEAHITNVAVYPYFRRMGLANKLLQAALRLCHKHDIVAITLEVRDSNIPARNLYTKFGFIEEGIRKKYYENGEDAIIMWKRTINL
ncbi:ribosomal protein S18-alanine N-acetyltransferase [Clostridium sediminicola]|uniref:ribosomal protein S18-alanine N-acetyltransferase n=1 Tax=Clostridium sediminicola TaxID=3114879 RepID=UPI0031F1E89A